MFKDEKLNITNDEKTIAITFNSNIDFTKFKKFTKYEFLQNIGITADNEKYFVKGVDGVYYSKELLDNGLKSIVKFLNNKTKFKTLFDLDSQVEFYFNDKEPMPLVIKLNEEISFIIAPRIEE